MSVPLPMKRWQEFGVRLPRGKALPKSDAPASLVSGSTRHFLVDANYDAILEYNCAHSYAITVALLGDAIASNKAPAASKPAKAAASKGKPRG
jgi:membrane-bound lytic murein transglycosylase B